MKQLTLQNIITATGGRYHGDEALLSREVSSVTTDSRTAGKNSLFIAIVGERSDGHDYIASVFEKGALCALGQRPVPDCPGPYIQVTSTLQALKDIAAFYRSTLRIPVVGITGSVGKTSTKEMIASVLSQKYNVLKTEGNFNNEIGLPLTVLRIREEHQIAVLEMGISQFGEMTRLTNIARPDIAVITNIGQAHLENLGSRDGILKAKTEIFGGLMPGGTVILNGDDDKLHTIHDVQGKTPVFFGLDSKCDVYADNIENLGLAGTRCTIHLDGRSLAVTIHIPGAHMVYNALAGACAGHACGLTDQEIIRGIQALQPVAGRNHIIQAEGLTVIDDCYNANPVSMKASIDVLSAAPGRKVCVLGDMFELGKNERELHYQTGTYAAERRIDVLLTAGTLAKEITKGAQEHNGGHAADTERPYICSFDTRDQLAAALPSILKEGDTVLIKASHGMHFEKLVELLTQQ